MKQEKVLGLRWLRIDIQTMMHSLLVHNKKSNLLVFFHLISNSNELRNRIKLDAALLKAPYKNHQLEEMNKMLR